MTINFEKVRKIRVAKAALLAAGAFILAPVGFGLSIMTGAAAAIVSVAYDIQKDNPDIELSLNDLMNDETFNEVSEYAVLAAGCGIIIAMPISLSFVGLAFKLAMLVAIRRMWYRAIAAGGRVPYINKEWTFKFELADRVYMFKM